MNNISDICIYTEIVLIVYQFFKSVRSKDISSIWSPIIIISLVYIYYCIIPHFYTGKTDFAIDEEANNGYLFHIASLLSYICILIGFKIPTRGKSFTKWNNLVNDNNAKIYGIILCAIGIVGYSFVHGFNFSLGYDGNVQFNTGVYDYYLDNLIELFPVGMGLLVCVWKKDKKQFWVFILIWLCFVTLVLRGSRGRMIMALLPLLVMWHSYPMAKKVRYHIMAVIIVAVYLFFAVMDSSRVYYGGINIESASQMSLEEASKGAGENYTVYEYTMKSMDLANETGIRYYFAPILTAVLMPIPRAIFPWKPDAGYLNAIEATVYGDNSGNAFLNFAESYISFGWFGVIFWALFLGWLARRFWDNFANNRTSIGAILLLGAFDGMCYIIISRGYLAQSFTSFMYSICLPFWITTVINKFNKMKRIK